MKRKTRIDEATISANIRLDKRRKRANGTYPVKLEVYFKGIKKRYDLKTYFSLEDWEKMNSPKLKDSDLKKSKSSLELGKSKATKIIDDLKNDFSFSSFEQLFFNKPHKKTNLKEDVYAYFEKHIKNLQKNEQYGYAESFNSTLTNLRVFSTKLSFKNLTPDKLYEFENSMVLNDKHSSAATIAIYMRNIRRIYNLAIDEGIVKREDYPFGQQSKKKYQIREGRNFKKALGEDVIKRICEYKTYSDEQERARDIWIFSFVCNGMNLTDICRLKYENINSEFFYFERRKIDGRQRKHVPIEVYLIDKAKEIIAKWGNKTEDSNDFIFPFLQNGQTEKEKRKIVKNLTRSINYYTKKIGIDLKLNINLTSGVSRHSYCTILRYHGVPDTEIGESVGHTSPKTTSNYFAQFNQERKKTTASIINNIF